MIKALKTLTINRLGKWLAAFLILTAVVTIVTSGILIREITNLNTLWVSSERNITQKQAYLSVLRGSIGYGGMIHNFKNYLLRREGKYLLSAHRSMLEAKIIFSGYRALDISAEEESAISDIEAVAGEYMKAITRTELLINNNYVLSQIDQQVSVDDTPALLALRKLTNEVGALRQEKSKVVSGSIDSLAKTIYSSAIGIGLLLVIVILTLAWFLRFRLIKPLGKLVTAIGEVDPSAPGLHRIPSIGKIDDELGMVASATNRFLDSMENHLSSRRNAEKALGIAKEEAENANQAKSEFLSSMSHELRTPLNAILGFTQLLQFDPSTPLTDGQKDSTDQIIKGGNHLLELIDQVLELAKIEAGKISVSIEPVSIRQLIDESIVMVQTMAEKRNITIDVNTDNCPNVEVMADHTRLKQVLLNLLSNAVKYNNEGGSISIIARVEGDQFCNIAVTDTGNGIAEDQYSSVFKPFNRLGHETSEIEGTGIGLVITRKMMHIMKGEIGFESEVGKGTTFWVEIPLAAQSSLPTASKTTQAESNAVVMESAIGAEGEGYKVLYVEDNPANLMLMEKIIERMSGVDLISAHNAELGLEMAEAKHPDIILLDINLPGMDGYEALERLKVNEKTSSIPVIAVTAQATKADITRGRHAGFVSYITKPIQVPELIKAIEENIGTKE